jgi:hypothetical protein
LGPLPFGVIMPSFVGKADLEKCMPFRLFLTVNVEVIGVCGGEEGPACWAKLQLGVVGRMAAVDGIVLELQRGSMG